jgi:8-oxo-dGTP diphosphatase
LSLRLRKEVQAVPRQVELTRRPAGASGIEVSVGILRDESGRILIGQRPAGKHFAGHWEFPGGKRQAGESRLEALGRELAEELGIRVVAAEPLLELSFDYPDRTVHLDVWWISAFEGTPRSREGQVLRWIAAAELNDVALLPADEPIVRAIEARCP